MPGTLRGTCTGCGQPRQLTTAGLIRSHRIRTTVCGGSFKRPVEAALGQPQPPDSPRQLPAPDEPSYGRSCDGGGCDAESIGWRWYRDQRHWLPVCGRHMEGPPGRTRVYDPTT